VEEFVILPLTDVDVACVGIGEVRLYFLDGLKFSRLSVVADEYASAPMLHGVMASDV
jgi:hypothetical protein